MAITWSKESVESESSATLTWSVQKAYDYIGFLVDDMEHNAYSLTNPWTGFIYDMLNDAIQDINWNVPSLYAIISCTPTVDKGLFVLPDYALGRGFIYWVTWDGDRVWTVHDESVMIGEVSNLDRTSFADSGDVERYMAEGDRHIRLLPMPSTAKTLKMKIAVMPDAVDAVDNILPVLSQLNKAPALHAASWITAKQGKVELSREYRAEYARMLAKAKIENTPPVDAPPEPIPGKAWRSPFASGTGDDK